MSKFRRISAVVMALVLVMCVGYFSLMSTTSAWFYNSGVIDSGDSFVFGNLSMNTSFTTKSDIVFDGATRFADKNEILFDKVVHVEEIVVYNSGTVPARVYADASVSGDGENFRWFYFSDATMVDGSVKKTIEASLPEMTDAALDAYNLGADGNGGKYILVNPGEIATVKIASWIEYDEAESLDSYGVEFTLISTQDVEGAVKR